MCCITSKTHHNSKILLQVLTQKFITQLFPNLLYSSMIIRLVCCVCWQYLRSRELDVYWPRFHQHTELHFTSCTNCLTSGWDVHVWFERENHWILLTGYMLKVMTPYCTYTTINQLLVVVGMFQPAHHLKAIELSWRLGIDRHALMLTTTSFEWFNQNIRTNETASSTFALI